MTRKVEPQYKILVVDDDALTRNIARQELENENYSVYEAQNGQEGIDIFMVQLPDLILMDAVMPVMDGITACKLLSGLPGGARTPVLMMTSMEDDKTINRAFDAGVTDFIHKPVNWRILKWRLQRILEVQRTETTLREALQKLAASEEHFRQIVEISSDWIWEVDKDWNFTYLSSRIENVLGYSPQELIGRQVKDIMYRQPTSKIPGFQESIAIHKDGHPVYLESRGFRIYNEDHSLKGYSGVGRDITQRKQIEEVLRLNEVRTRALLDITQMSHLLVSDIAAFAVEKSIELTGSQLGFIGMCNENESRLEILAWDRQSLQLCKDKNRITVFEIGGGGLWAQPVLRRKPVVCNDMPDASVSGSQGLPEDHVEITRFLGVPVFDGEHIVLVVAVANKEVDYGDSDLRQLSLFGDGAWKTLRHRRDQQALAAEQKQLAVTLQSIADGVVTTGLDGNVLLLNPVAQAITGWNQEEARGMSICELLPEIERNMEYADKDDRESSRDEAREYQITFTTRVGSRKLLSISRAAMYDDNGNSMGSVLVLRDITERNKMEARLMLSQKMESIGQLAAGIAHEINTPMQYIGDNMNFLKEGLDGWMEYLAAVDHLLRQIEDESRYSSELERIQQKAEAIDLGYLRQEIPLAVSQSIEGIQHVNRLVSAMKKFSHPGDKEKILNNLNQAIEGTVVISRNEWKYAADLQTDLDPDLPQVYCLIDEINQVLLNMIVNSADAIKEAIAKGYREKGRIVVSTRTLPDTVEIKICDDGMGIPESIIQRIYDPFFTTKEVGKGTGQGLAIVHDIIVNKHKGKIEVKSKVGEGTSFIIHLPLRSK